RSLHSFPTRRSSDLESELQDELKRSLAPRGRDWLFELFAALGPQPGQLVVDVGARDARHAIRLVQEHGVRAVAVDPLPLHVELRSEEHTSELQSPYD